MAESFLHGLILVMVLFWSMFIGWRVVSIKEQLNKIEKKIKKRKRGAAP